MRCDLPCFEQVDAHIRVRLKRFEHRVSVVALFALGVYAWSIVLAPLHHCRKFALCVVPTYDASPVEVQGTVCCLCQASHWLVNGRMRPLNGLPLYCRIQPPPVNGGWLICEIQCVVHCSSL